MSRTKLPVSQERIAPFDLEAFVQAAATRNQRALESFTLPVPKAPDRWLSRDQCRPRPIEFTAEGEVEGGLSGLMGATIDVRCTRALLAPFYAKEGGHCDDPASAFFLEVASRMDGYPDYACFGAALRQQDKGRRSRELAGLHASRPGEDDLRHFRRRVGAGAVVELHPHPVQVDGVVHRSQPRLFFAAMCSPRSA